jgi:hypothetical protein
MKPSETEIITKYVTVHYGKCIGCNKFGKYVMIAISDENKKDDQGFDMIYDIFFTKEQATDILNKLNELLK